MPIILMLALAAAFSSCTRFANALSDNLLESLDKDNEDSETAADVVTHDIETPAFSVIDVRGAVKVVVSQDSGCTVRVRGDEKCIEKYAIDVEDGELEVRLADSDNVNVNRSTPHITLYVTVPRLDEVEISGACKLLLQGHISMDGDMEITGNGAVAVVVDTLDVANLEVKSSGAGSIKATRITSPGNVKMEMNGVGKIKAQVFCDKLSLELNGAGSAELTGECNVLRKHGNVATDIDTSGLKTN